MEENYLSIQYNYSFGSQSHPYVVGEGEIFFLGDNRRGSMDDRYYDEDNNNSHIDKLYRVDDVCGVVTDWSFEHRPLVKKVHTRIAKFKQIVKKIFQF